MRAFPPLPAHPRDAEPYPSVVRDDLDRLVAEWGMTVRQHREASRCQKCGHPEWEPDTDTYDTVQTPCDHGCCHVFRCAKCGHYSSGVGAAGCPCDDGI